MLPIVAGPWIGEFGWELMSWQGALRKLADVREVIVCCRRGHTVLYEDFAKTFVEHDLDVRRPDCYNGTIADQDAYSRLISRLLELGPNAKPNSLIPTETQKFIKYGTPDRTPENRYDIIIHARAPLNDAKRAWPPEKWEALTELLMDHNLRMAAIGTQAYYPKITADLRNIPLRETMDLIAGATMVIGPSSGPMHLASLCGTPHIVWTDNKVWPMAKMNNRQRYEKAWNPFNTPCKVLDDAGWDPTVESVASLVLQGVREWSSNPKP